MLAWASAVYAGYASKAMCSEIAPCRGFAYGAKPFKLSCHIVSAVCQAANTGEKDDGRGARPFVCVSVRDRTKRTELADWSQERQEWCFGEALTLEVNMEDEIVISLHRAQQLDLIVAAISLSATQVGEVCFPVSAVLQRLRMEDRDIDGLTYVTEGVRLDVIGSGAVHGRVTVAFETKQPPPRKTEAFPPATGPWCNFEALSARSIFNEHDTPMCAEGGCRKPGGAYGKENVGEQEFVPRDACSPVHGEVQPKVQLVVDEERLPAHVLPAPPPPPPVRLSQPRF